MSDARISTSHENEHWTPAPPALEPLAVGARDLARILGISEATLWRWDAGGELGPGGVKKRGRRLWCVAEVKEWVAAGMPSRDAWLALKRVNGSNHR